MLFTIGHSNHPIGRFIELLQQHRIDLLADVRSAPASRRYPQFNKAALEASLMDAGIDYVFFGRELGARRGEPEAYAGDKVSYDNIARLPLFQRGLERVRKSTGRNRVAIMCAEKEPLDCHRTLLICRYLRDDLEISHILADGNLESQPQTEQRLINASGMDGRQNDLFAGSGDSVLERAYRQRSPDRQA